MLYGSGLRADLTLPDGSVIPNGAELPGYVQVNFSLSHQFENVHGGPLRCGFDIINAFDKIIEMRDGTGVGVFAPQYGPRRGLFVGRDQGVLTAASHLNAELVLIGLLAGVATLLGGTLALRLADRIHLILGFSAGAVMGVALLDLVPEALALGRGAVGDLGVMTIMATGFLAYLIIGRTLLCWRRATARHRGHLGAGSLAAHSVLDGLGIGLGFQASAAVGLALTVAVLAHDLADGANTVNLSLEGSGDRRTARRWLAADAAAPLAGLVASRFIAPPAGLLGVVLALFAGFFLYIGASDLLPESHRRHPRPWTTISTVLGAAMIWAVVRVSSP